jgi:hypothetical protein
VANAGDLHVERIVGDSMFPNDEVGRWFQEDKIPLADGFYIVGCVVYKDQFGKERHTKFCNWYQGANIVNETPPIFLYSFFGLNDAD